MTMLRDAVMQAATRPEVRDAVARVYADLERKIDARKPVCNASGRCCRFEEFGHRLYVTTIELAAFVANLSDRRIHSSPGGCPFQVQGLCSVHVTRPFGCRVFFCDATSDEWQHQQYERFHRELKRLHEKLHVPYRYLEWREALGALDLLGTCETASGGKALQSAGGRLEIKKRLSLPQLPL